MGHRNSANSRASVSEKLYLSTSILLSGQNFSLRILFRSPCLSKKSLERAPPMATCKPRYERQIELDEVISEKLWECNDGSHLSRHLSKELHHQSKVILKSIESPYQLHSSQNNKKKVFGNIEYSPHNLSVSKYGDTLALYCQI